MVDPLPIDPRLGALGSDASNAAGGAARVGGDRDQASGASGRGLEFRAMLERLEVRATHLAEESRSVAGPDELGRALDTARASLEEALSLKDQLLEAYRQAERTRESAAPRDTGDPAEPGAEPRTRKAS